MWAVLYFLICLYTIDDNIFVGGFAALGTLFWLLRFFGALINILLGFLSNTYTAISNSITNTYTAISNPIFYIYGIISSHWLLLCALIIIVIFLFFAGFGRNRRGPFEFYPDFFTVSVNEITNIFNTISDSKRRFGFYGFGVSGVLIIIAMYSQANNEEYFMPEQTLLWLGAGISLSSIILIFWFWQYFNHISYDRKFGNYGWHVLILIPLSSLISYIFFYIAPLSQSLFVDNPLPVIMFLGTLGIVCILLFRINDKLIALDKFSDTDLENYKISFRSSLKEIATVHRKKSILDKFSDTDLENYKISFVSSQEEIDNVQRKKSILDKFSDTDLENYKISFISSQEEIDNAQRKKSILDNFSSTELKNRNISFRSRQKEIDNAWILTKADRRIAQKNAEQKARKEAALKKQKEQKARAAALKKQKEEEAAEKARKEAALKKQKEQKAREEAALKKQKEEDARQAKILEEKKKEEDARQAKILEEKKKQEAAKAEKERIRQEFFDNHGEIALKLFRHVQKDAEVISKILENSMNEDFLKRLNHDFSYAPHFIASKSWVLDLWGAMGKPKPIDDWHPWHSWVMRIAYAISIGPHRQEYAAVEPADYYQVFATSSSNPADGFRSPKNMPKNKMKLIASLVKRFENLEKQHNQVYTNVCEKSITPAMGLQFLSLFDEEVEDNHPSLYVALVDQDINYGHGKSLLDSYDSCPELIRRVIEKEDEQTVCFDLGIDYAGVFLENQQQEWYFADAETSNLLLDLAKKELKKWKSQPEFQAIKTNPPPLTLTHWNLLETPPIEDDGKSISLKDYWHYDCELVKIVRCVKLGLEWYDAQAFDEETYESFWEAPLELDYTLTKYYYPEDTEMTRPPVYELYVNDVDDTFEWRPK